MKETQQNTAQVVKEYYSHEDFRSNYELPLLESFRSNEDVILNRIQELFNISNYEVQLQYGKVKYVDTAQAKEIYDYILDNLKEFTSEFNGYYVGYTSLQSISFGEQYENLKNFDGEDLEILKPQFEDEGFTVIDNAAYYDLQGGLHVDLLGGDLTEVLKDLNLLPE